MKQTTIFTLLIMCLFSSTNLHPMHQIDRQNQIPSNSNTTEIHALSINECINQQYSYIGEDVYKICSDNSRNIVQNLITTSGKLRLRGNTLSSTHTYHIFDEKSAVDNENNWECYKDGGLTCWVNLTSVVMIDENDGWAVGDGGIMLHFDGYIWEIVQTINQNIRLNSLSMVTENNIWAAGYDFSKQHGLILTLEWFNMG